MSAAISAAEKVDGFTRKSVRKAQRQKRSQGSSQFRSQGSPVELSPLPQLKGTSLPSRPSLRLQVPLSTPPALAWPLPRTLCPLAVSSPAPGAFQVGTPRQEFLLCSHKPAPHGSALARCPGR